MTAIKNDTKSRITARLSNEDATLIQELANRTGESTSVLIRKALQRYYHDEQVAAAVLVTPPPAEITDPTPPTPTPITTSVDNASPLITETETDTETATPVVTSITPQKPIPMDYGIGIRVLTVPFNPATGLFDDEAVQRFLLNKRVRRLVPAFFSQEGRAYWSVWVEYEPLSGAPIPSRPSTNKEFSLNATQQGIYDRLSAWRKTKAEASGVPVFVVATNRELADVARQQPRTLEALRQIRGFGKSKVERYGREVLTIVSGFLELQ